MLLIPKVTIHNVKINGIIYRIFNVNGTAYHITKMITIQNEISILNPFIIIVDSTKINLGIYTFEIMGLLFFTILILLFNELLKNAHAVKPIKIKAVKYFSLASKTKPKMKLYTSIIHSGSRIHQIQFKYDPATSDFISDFALKTAKPPNRLKSLKALFTITVIFSQTLIIKIFLVGITLNKYSPAL